MSEGTNTSERVGVSAPSDSLSSAGALTPPASTPPEEHSRGGAPTPDEPGVESSPSGAAVPARQPDETLPDADTPTATGVPAVPAEHVTVKTTVNMRYRQVDANGKVTTIDVNPKAAKRLFVAGVVLLVVSALLIFAATLFLLGRLFG